MVLSDSGQMESIEGMMHLHMLGVGMVVFRILILLNPFRNDKKEGCANKKIEVFSRTDVHRQMNG